MAELALIKAEDFWIYLFPGVLLGLIGTVCILAAAFASDIKTIRAVRVTAGIGFVFWLAAGILMPIGINRDTLGNSLTSLPEGSYKLEGVFKIDNVSTDQPGPHLHVVIRGRLSSSSTEALEQRSLELPTDAYILVDGKNVSNAMSAFPEVFMRGGTLKVYYDNQERLEKRGGHEWKSEKAHTQKIKVYEFVGATAYPLSQN